MRHPKRYCVDCKREVSILIQNRINYSMYHCRQCGTEICRMGDGESIINPRRLRGGIAKRSLGDYETQIPLTFAAMSNPDILSDEQKLVQNDDETAEEIKQEHFNQFLVAYQLLTVRQRQIVEAVEQYGTESKAAVALGITQPVINKTLQQIRKKLNKNGYNLDK